MRITRICIVIALAALLSLITGCGAVRQMSQADTVRADAIHGEIAKADQMGAMDCAPKALANAIVALDVARHQAMEYHDRKEIDEEFEEAEEAADALLAAMESCGQAGQRKVASADADGDSVPDNRDECPGTLRGAPVDARGCDRDRDKDGDALTDWEEIQRYGTDPNNPDTDADGLRDGDEVLSYNTDPKNPDTDGDELRDGDEVLKYRTSAVNVDTDGGSVNDGPEVLAAGTDPLDPGDDVK